MKHKTEKPVKKKPHSIPQKKRDEQKKPPAQKVMVGEDEFCPTCMEWRAFDEVTGKCRVCGRVIKKLSPTHKIINEYDMKDFENEHDEPQETGEFQQ